MLSDLCSICHVNPRRYVCPRCSLQTCSLPCVKKHKSRSQCSGIRDPGTYVRRQGLASPSALDQDFNFIAGLERSLEKADRITADQRHDVFEQHRSGQGWLNLETKLRQSGANVRRAPAGISRSKQNKTYYQKRDKRLMWTIEWVLPCGTHIFKNHAETLPVGKAWASIPGSKSQILGKRKAEDSCQPIMAEVEEARKPHLPEDKWLDRAAAPSSTPSPSTKPDLAFYLHYPICKPNTKALISVDLNMSIKEAVRGRTLLEFPTIFVLPNAPDNLPEGFILAHETNSTISNIHALKDTQLAEECSHDDLAASNTAKITAEEVQSLGLDEKILEVDETKILEVLRKDLGAVT